MTGLFDLFFDRLPVAPAQTMPDGTRSRGWTLRTDRLNGNATRFDWIHGTTTDDTHRGDASEREALRSDVLRAASRIAREAGFKVKPDGIGLLIAAPAEAGRSRA